ncbi:hypothetical protein BU15DRAFT_48132, partial [Melanogaster broomeanus]
GVDETVTVPTLTDACEARGCLGLPAKVPMFQMSVPSLTFNEDLRFIVPAPIASPYAPPGRATRGFVAYDPARKKKVYLKDTWPVVLESIEPEGKTYKLLHENHVQNIAPCLAAGDVSTDLYHATQAHTYKAASGLACHGPTAVNLTPHRHYWLVLDIIGVKLTEFKKSRKVVLAVRDTLYAHEDAFQCSVLHRDISPGNILITDGGGILINWDLCKHINASSGPRQSTRTGTWQFMSAVLVRFRDIPHTVHDDLESVLYVILWVAIMYSPSNLT